MNQLEHVEPNFAVEAELHERILEKSQITFAEFMQICLYSAEGYYASHSAIGHDFRTSPETHPAFGRTIANAIVDLEEPRGRPLSILEMGAGNGRLAEDILQGLTRTQPTIQCNYSISEISSDLIERQQRTLHGLPVTWYQGPAEEVAVSDIDLALSNELLDVFPVHRLLAEGDALREVYITTDTSGRFIEVHDDVSLQAQREIEDLELPDLRDGHEATVSPARSRWLQNMANSLRPGGHLLTIDYPTESTKGNSYIPRVYADFLEPPTGHPVELAYERPGTMDVTASVDFAQLTVRGLHLGLRTVYNDTQASFLRKYGFEAERNAVMAREKRATGKVNAMAHYFGSYTLLALDHMGGHRVLIQQKPEE